jgi:hypothetical protein
MVRPITVQKSYFGETGKSTKAENWVVVRVLSSALIARLARFRIGLRF